LFTWVTVKSLSTAMAVDERTAALRYAEGGASRETSFRLKGSRKLKALDCIKRGPRLLGPAPLLWPYLRLLILLLLLLIFHYHWTA
jgi:hypothetical protein